MCGAMTELIISRGDTFPRSYLDTYRNSRACEYYNDLKTSKSDELVLQNSEDIPITAEIQHGHSENLLDTGCMSPTEGDFLDKPELLPPMPARSHRRRVQVYDKVDPEDSIRDIVTENDFYKFVLFKKHYDKYLHLSQKYEEARNIAYYLEEKYHEVKSERDGLIQERDRLSKRLESNECLLKEKEDEVFTQFEKVVLLEEQCEKLRAEKEKYVLQRIQIEKERDEALRLLKEQARESESNRRKLERARQEVFRHMTKIKNEKDILERENGQLKEALEAERKGFGRLKREPSAEPEREPTSEEQVLTLKSQFQKAFEHLATCKRKKCSVCTYTKAVFGNKNRHKYDKKLFSCLQTPFLEVRNMLKPPPSPIKGALLEGESLSEWFCPLEDPSECSSFSLPFAELAISYMDETSDASGSQCFDVNQFSHDNLSHITNNRGYGSDSGFSSDVCGDCKSDVTTPKEKFSPKGTLDDAECAKLTRTKWTASFRKLINRIRK